MFRDNFFKDVIYWFLERGEGRERERERNINVWLLLTCPEPGDLVHNPGLCPDWESNQRPFGSQADAHSTEPHQPGHELNCSISWLWWWLHKFISVLKFIELHSKKTPQTFILSILYNFLEEISYFKNLSQRERERKGGGRERNLDLSFYLFMHSLVPSCMCPDQRSNPQP